MAVVEERARASCLPSPALTINTSPCADSALSHFPKETSTASINDVKKKPSHLGLPKKSSSHKVRGHRRTRSKTEVPLETSETSSGIEGGTDGSGVHVARK